MTLIIKQYGSEYNWKKERKKNWLKFVMIRYTFDINEFTPITKKETEQCDCCLWLSRHWLKFLIQINLIKKKKNDNVNLFEIKF